MMNRADGTGITSGLTEIANQMQELNTEIDTAENPLEVMNALRGKQGSVEEYRMELAEMVGSKDAEKTPESVLTLVQPLMTAMEATQQSVPQSGIAETSFSESRTPEEIYSDYYKQFNYTPEELALSQQYAPQGGITNALTPEKIANNPVALGMMSDEWRQQNIPQGFKNGGVVYRSRGSRPEGEVVYPGMPSGVMGGDEIVNTPGDGRQNNLMAYLQMLQNQQPKPKTYQEYYDAYSKNASTGKSAYDALGYQSLINLGSTIASAPKGQLLDTVLDPENMQRVSDPLLKMVMGKAQEEKTRKASIAKSATEAKMKADEAYQKSQTDILKAGLPEVLKSMKPNESLYGSPEYGYYIYNENTGNSRNIGVGKEKRSEKQIAFQNLRKLRGDLANVKFGSNEYFNLKKEIANQSDIINPRGQFNTILDDAVEKFAQNLMKDDTIGDPEKQEKINKYEKDLVDKWLDSQTSEQSMWNPDEAMDKEFAGLISKKMEEIAKNVDLSGNLKNLSATAKTASTVFETGSFADTRLAFLKLVKLAGGEQAFNDWLASKGMDQSAFRDLLNTSELDKQVMAGELIRTSGAQFATYMAENFPGNLNQSEIDLVKQAGPQLTTSKGGLDALAYIYGKANERAKAEQNIYDSFISTKAGEKVIVNGEALLDPVTGKEILGVRNPTDKYTTGNKLIRDYRQSVTMVDENQNIIDEVLLQKMGALPTENEANALLDNRPLKVPALGNSVAIEYNIPPKEKLLKQEIDNIKPELQQFLDNNGFQMQLDDPNTYNKNEMEALANHINLNLTTPKIQNLLNDIGASMNKKVTIIAPSLTGYIYGTF